MPQTDDYAIVVGISKYPGFGVPPDPPGDLQASDSDAVEIYDWLTSATGGGLPKVNVRSIRTSDFQGAADQPAATRIREAFRWLYDLADKNSEAGNGLQVGRRLYLYMSGHGFSPDRKQGGLFTADARSFDPVNCYASGWLRWFQDNGYFKEFVLWMDCCMDRNFAVVPEPTFTSRGVQRPAGPTFVGLAARRPLKTVERPILEDQGRIHGVFTWTLLQGLKGGAVNPATGQITGRSLGDYLLNGMKRYLTPEDLANPNIVSQEPDIDADANLIIANAQVIFAAAQVSEKPKTPTTLRVPADWTGEDALLWSGSPPQATKTKIKDAVVSANLDIGLHLLEVPSKNVRHGFEVTATAVTEIRLPPPTGAPPVANLPVVAPAAATTYSINVLPNQETAEIFIINQQLQLAKQAKALLFENLPLGLYKVKLRIGRASDEVILLLDRNVTLQDQIDVFTGERVLADPTLGLKLHRPQLASAAPIDGNSLTHEYQVSAAESWTEPSLRPTALLGQSHRAASAEVRLMARVWSKGGVSPGAEPWKGVELTRADGRSIVELASQPVQRPQDDPFVKVRVDVVPGNYFLRKKQSDGRKFEQSLVVPKDWALEVFLLSVSSPTESDSVAGNAQCLAREPTIRMRPVSQISPPSDPIEKEGILRLEQVIESARTALADERNVLNANLEMLLLHKFENPLAGIIGAHLLIMEADRNPADAANRLGILDEVVPNLRMLVGAGHPDVEAISLRCPSEDLRTTESFQLIPMFARSWLLMVEASAENPALVPEGLWQRIHAWINLGGYLVWARDSETQDSHLRHLNNCLSTMVNQESAPAGELGGPESVPDQTPHHFALRGGLASAPAAAARILEATSGTVSPESLVRRLGVPAAALRSLLKGQSD